MTAPAQTTQAQPGFNQGMALLESAIFVTRILEISPWLADPAQREHARTNSNLELRALVIEFDEALSSLPKSAVPDQLMPYYGALTAPGYGIS
ncbi:MAG: hypothetical protein AABX00_00980 [Nanoarchaeota archaeon]|mgnify:FL=1